MLGSVSIATACRTGTEPEEPIKLRFEGTVLADGKSIEGAKVRIDWTLFVWTLPVSEVVTDSNGKYALELESDCERGTELNTSPGNSLILVAYLAGYGDLSSVNMNRALYCTTDVQRVDFPLRKL
jgi:hypothetical protein